MPRSKKPENAITIQAYGQLVKYVEAFNCGYLGLLIVIGDPGQAKTRIVRDVVRDDVCLIEGHATAFGIYRRLYEFRNRPVVIDDVDSLYRDKAIVRLLKCLCQTERRKTLAWHSAARSLEAQDIPREFCTTSNVLIIANDWQSVSVNVSALQDRGHVVFFEPSAAEVHQFVARWFHDQEIFDFIGMRLHLIERPTMRDYVLADERKRAGLPWQGFLLEKWGVTKEGLLVAELVNDHSYAVEADRVEVFRKTTKLSRATYFRLKGRIQPNVDAPRTTLKAKRPAEFMGGGLANWLGNRFGKIGEG